VDKRTLQIVDTGLAYDTIVNRAGNVVSSSAIFSATNPNGLDTPGGLSRFCSSSLFEAHQFGAGNGLADRIYFANEESPTATNDASQYALDVQTNTLYAVPWLGHAGYENVAEINTGTTNKVAFVIGDDRSAVPMLLYVGDKNAKGDGSFLDRNGLGQGKLYVWVADDPTDPNDTIQADARDFKGTNNSTNGKFVEIDYYNPNLAGNGDYDAQGFATQAKQDALAADVDAFLFARLEDVSTNPQDGTQFVTNATGRDSIFDGADSWGTVYKFDIDFNNIGTGDISAKINILYDGDDAGKQDLGLRSPDNLDWADNGKIYLQEDRSINSFGAVSGQEASVFTLDPSVADPSSTLTRVAQVDRTALPTGQTDPVPTEIGNWETSGILDVSTLFGNQAGEMLVFNVQAHSLKDGAIADKNLVEGGQLVSLMAPGANLIQETETVSGTPQKDVLLAGTDFSGLNDQVFTGAGDDEVDVLVGGALTGFNRINLGSGKDTVYVSEGDRANGGSGDDYFEATDASKYRLSGGKGDDIFVLGMDGRAIGGDGNDQFYVGEGGDNLLTGGAGTDQFWLLTDVAPDPANTVADFTNLIFSGNNIALNGDVFATLNGFNATTLTAADFVFM
jgi:hypothetical protein